MGARRGEARRAFAGRNFQFSWRSFFCEEFSFRAVIVWGKFDFSGKVPWHDTKAGMNGKLVGCWNSKMTPFSLSVLSSCRSYRLLSSVPSWAEKVTATSTQRRKEEKKNREWDLN